MTPLQGEPPKIDFKLPSKAKKWLIAFRDFVMQSQPITIDGGGVTISQTPKGRLLKAQAPIDERTGTYATVYEMKTDTGGTAATDVWEFGKAYATDGGAEITHNPPYDSVKYKGPRLYVNADHVQTMTDSNGDTTSFNAYVLYVFVREVTYDAYGALRKIGAETKVELFTASQSVLTQT